MEYRIAPKKKKVKTRPYSMLIQKSKGSSAFDEQKVKNIAIKYRLQSIFCNPDYDIKKLIMMQKLEARTVGLKPTRLICTYVDLVKFILLRRPWHQSLVHSLPI